MRDPFLDSWILYQFNDQTHSCDIKEVFRTKDLAVEAYQAKNLHIQYNQAGTREVGDVGLVVHQKTVYFESNVHKWTNWGGEAEINLQTCRDTAVQEGYLEYKQLQPNRCFYMHTMDFTGEYLDYVLSIDTRSTTANGEQNVIIQHNENQPS